MKDRMNIALVTPEFVSESNFDGGLSNYLYRLSLSLIKLGHFPTIYILSDKESISELDGINIIKVKNNFSKLQNYLIKQSYYKLFKSFFVIVNSYEIKARIEKENIKNKIDVIQYPHLGGEGIIRPLKIPVVIRMSSYTPMVLRANKILGGIQQNFWEQLAIRRADSVFSPSKNISDIETKILGKKVQVIESPFIKEPYDYDYSIYNEFLEKKKYLLYYGTLNVLKGIELIGRILKELFLYDSSLSFAFVGKDSGINNQPAINYLKNKAHPFENNVIYIDKIKHKFLYPIIENSEFVVLPSRFDNFPNTCIESMAHKKIVLGTFGTSFEQLIVDGESGFLCEVDNQESLLNTIHKILNLSENQKKEIENNAYNRSQTLKPEIVVNQLLDFYTCVINQFKYQT